MKAPKILLIQPSTLRINYGDYASVGAKTQPIGICYLAGFLEQHDFNVEILDAEVLNYSLEQTLKHISESNPNIICISIITTTYPNSITLAKKIKERFPAIIIIVGGPHITAVPKQSIENECFDVGVVGEGEQTLLEIVEEHPDNNWSKIDGVIYRDNGKIVMTNPRSLMKDLNVLPFLPYHLLPDIRLYTMQLHSTRATPSASIMGSRGCPFQCIYCDKSVFGTKYRTRTPKNIVNEMEHIANNFGAKEIMFHDDNITLDRQHIISICENIIKKNLKVYWACNARVDSLDKELLYKMKKARCWMIAVGIESGNQKILDIANKKITLNNVRKTVTLINRIGIKVRGYFMLGLPGETKETIEDTINFALSIPLNTAEFTICTPFPNTYLYNHVSEYGTLDNHDYSKFSEMFPVFVPFGLTADYLSKKQDEGHKRFYLRFSKIIDFILQIKSINDIKRYWTGFKLVIKK